MLRTFVCAVFALLLCVGFTLAADVKGKVKKVDADKGTITVTVGDKDMDFTIDKDTKFTDADGKALDGGLKASPFKNPGANVTLSTDGAKVKSVQVTDKK